jgi:2,4-dienoyl-CoA reductase-like NADH-dependent reductase (Old Yellow Enzyme family)
MLPCHQPLFDPIHLGKHRLKNRVVLAPTHVGTATEKGGRVTDQTLCYYFARSRGGIGLAIVEVTGITGRHAYTPGLGLGIASDKSIPGMNDLARVIHWGGAKAILQLTLGQGVQAFFHHEKRPLVGPSAVAAVLPDEGLPKPLAGFRDIAPETPAPLTVEDIRLLKSDVLNASKRAKTAGFEGIELHGAHGYLLAQFTSPYFNQRSDDYGGSQANRNRLSTEIVDQIKETLGKSFIVGYRLSAREWISGGTELPDSIQLAKDLQDAGVDYLSISQGCYGSIDRIFPKEEGAILEDASRIKKEVHIPVMCANFQHPDTAAKAVEDGKVDMIALSRPLLADPLWVKKVQDGQPENINACIRCYQCIQSAILNHQPVRCPVNPVLGFERFDPECLPRPPKGGSGGARNGAPE